MIILFDFFKFVFSTNVILNSSIERESYFNYIEFNLITNVSYDSSCLSSDNLMSKNISGGFEIINKDYQSVSFIGTCNISNQRTKDNEYKFEFNINERVSIPILSSEMNAMGYAYLLENDFHIYKLIFVLEEINNSQKNTISDSLAFYSKKIIYDNFVNPLAKNHKNFIKLLKGFKEFFNDQVVEDLKNNYQFVSMLTSNEFKINIEKILLLSEKTKEKRFKKVNKNIRNVNVCQSIYDFLLKKAENINEDNNINDVEYKLCFILQDMINLFNHYRNKKLEESKDYGRIKKWEIWTFIRGKVLFELNVTPINIIR